jgi:hypothetical protein
VNEDIIDLENPIDIEMAHPYDMLNFALKPGLKENENYILVDRDTWAIFE